MHLIEPSVRTLINVQVLLAYTVYTDEPRVFSMYLVTAKLARATLKLYHLPMTKPSYKALFISLSETAAKLDLTCYLKGTVVCIDKTCLLIIAVSNIFRRRGADLVNMTIIPEPSLNLSNTST